MIEREDGGSLKRSEQVRREQQLLAKVITFALNSGEKRIQDEKWESESHLYFPTMLP